MEEVRGVQSSSGICVEIAGGVQVCVPDDIQLMTPYVLQEQHDWFEDEIKFLRRTLRPGQYVMDCGANYGVYSLTAAMLVGPDGRVIALEPIPATVNWLRRSAGVNGLANVHVIEAAVSDKTGYGSMTISENCELNILVGPGDAWGGVPVIITTLDDLLREFAWPRMDFVKIDVEGHEASVIEGGRRFFEMYSPLVMFEIKAGDKVDLEPLQRFESIGYSAYRLVPGLDVLAPFRRGEPIDGYQLNLFCCKRDRAQQLEQEERLVFQVSSELPDLDGDNWAEWMRQFPYGRQLAAIWKEKTGVRPIQEWDAYRRMLNAYVYARSHDEKPATRYACLLFAYKELSRLLSRAGNHPRLLSFARISAELGMRQHAVAALQHMLDIIRDGSSIFVGEPFLSVSPEFEQVNPGGNLTNWICASVLERVVSLSTFSGYFAPDITASLVPKLSEIGFTTETMERRLRLFHRRFPSAQL